MLSLGLLNIYKVFARQRIPNTSDNYYFHSLGKEMTSGRARPPRQFRDSFI